MSFWTAWAIPGVAAFSLTLFFAKLVAYTFLYWLPCGCSLTAPSCFCYCLPFAGGLHLPLLAALCVDPLPAPFFVCIACLFLLAALRVAALALCICIAVL